MTTASHDDAGGSGRPATGPSSSDSHQSGGPGLRARSPLGVRGPTGQIRRCGPGRGSAIASARPAPSLARKLSSLKERLLPLRRPSGSARLAVGSVSRWHWHSLPGASSTTSGCSPALANSAARVIGSLSMRTVSRVSPSALRRTITDRLRCRSMPTYCRCCFTGFSSVVSGLVWRPRGCLAHPVRSGGRRPAGSRAGRNGSSMAITLVLVLGARPGRPTKSVTQEQRCAPSWASRPLRQVSLAVLYERLPRVVDSRQRGRLRRSGEARPVGRVGVEGDRRWARISGAVPQCTLAGVCRPSARWRCAP